jgi:hypothetical protein
MLAEEDSLEAERLVLRPQTEISLEILGDIGRRWIAARRAGP